MPESKRRPDLRHRIIVITLLLSFAAVATTARLLLQKPGSFPAGDGAWSVTLSATVFAEEAGALIRLAPPWDTPHARLYGQSLVHAGMHRRRTKADSRNRDIVLVATRAGELTIEARYDLHISQVPRPQTRRPTLKESDRAAWLLPSEGIPVEAPAVAAVIEKLTAEKPETPALVDRLFEHISERIRIVPAGSDDGGTAIEQRLGSALGSNRAMVALLRAAHLPARVVTGLDLSAAEDRQPRYWVEAYFQERWHPLDVASGYLEELPSAYVPMKKGGESVASSEDASLTNVRWKIQPATPPSGLLASEKPHLFHILDLTRLSPTTRAVLALLLLLPLGALSTEALRQFVGIRTYGTFTPTLLALAAVYVDWVTATVTFALVTALGIAGRAMMPNLRLTRVPRLSSVFTLIALAMALVVSMLTYLDPAIDSAVVLLPIVILTTLVDRIYSVADERGLQIALFRLGWTVTAAVLSMVILLQGHWGEWLLAYPEVHAVTVAVIVLLGWYRGKRLADFRGLGWLREPIPKPAAQKPETPDQVSGQSSESK